MRNEAQTYISKGNVTQRTVIYVLWAQIQIGVQGYLMKQVPSLKEIIIVITLINAIIHKRWGISAAFTRYLLMLFSKKNHNNSVWPTQIFMSLSGIAFLLSILLIWLCLCGTRKKRKKGKTRKEKGKLGKKRERMYIEVFMFS